MVESAFLNLILGPGQVPQMILLSHQTQRTIFKNKRRTSGFRPVMRGLGCKVWRPGSAALWDLHRGCLLTGRLSGVSPIQGAPVTLPPGSRLDSGSPAVVDTNSLKPEVSDLIAKCPWLRFHQKQRKQPIRGSCRTYAP